MSRVTDFSKITGTAEIIWEMETATPLCIKAGSVSSWNQTDPNFSRNQKLRLYNASFDFFKKDIDKEDGASSVSDFYYDTYIDNNELKIRYKVPASSIRGALRSYTIKRFVEKKYRDADINEKDPNEEEKKERTQKFKYALQNIQGWHIVQNLFGIGTDSEDEKLEKESVAGRLQVSIDDLQEFSEKEFSQNLIFGDFKDCSFGSTHGKMQITTRNPLDRITNAAKEGGLHSFMELSKGNVFRAHLRITNPVPEDLGLIAFWETGIKSGLLRLGGLTSIGRGRLNIKTTKVKLFLRENNEFNDFEKTPENLPKNSPKNQSDILGDIFKAYSTNDWQNLRKKYLKKLEDLYNKGCESVKKEASNE